MNESGTAARIPLTLDVDASSVAQAQAAAEKFEGTIEQLRTQLEALRAQFTKTFNQQTAGLGGQMQAASYAAFKQAPPGQAGLNQAIVGATPQLQQLQARIAHLEQLEASGAVTGPAAATATRAATTAARQETSRQGRPAHQERRQPFSERLAHNVARSRPLATLGAFAQGDFVAGGRTLARVFIETLATTPRARGAAGGLGTAASVAASGAASGGADLAGAAEGGAAAGGASGLMGLLMSPVGLIGAGIAAMGVVALGVKSVQAQVAGQEVLLRGSVGGLAHVATWAQHSAA